VLIITSAVVSTEQKLNLSVGNHSNKVKPRTAIY